MNPYGQTAEHKLIFLQLHLSWSIIIFKYYLQVLFSLIVDNKVCENFCQIFINTWIRPSWSIIVKESEYLLLEILAHHITYFGALVASNTAKSLYDNLNLYLVASISSNRVKFHQSYNFIIKNRIVDYNHIKS